MLDIAFIAYAVRDIQSAVAFYRDVVGLSLGEIANDEFVEFNAGTGTFAIDSSSAGYEPGSCNGVNFEVQIWPQCARGWRVQGRRPARFTNFRRAGSVSRKTLMVMASACTERSR